MTNKPTTGALRAAERIMRVLMNLEINEPIDSLCIPVAPIIDNESGLRALLEAADECLRRCKRFTLCPGHMEHLEAAIAKVSGEKNEKGGA